MFYQIMLIVLGFTVPDLLSHILPFWICCSIFPRSPCLTPLQPPFTPSTTQKINILKKWKKCLDILPFYTCTINYDHMIYGSSDIEHDRQNVFVILDLFLPLYLPNNPKKQNFEKMKKTPGDIINLQKCTKNYDHMLQCFWDTTRDECNLYFSFHVIFNPFTPLKKEQKNPRRYHHFTPVYHKLWSHDVRFLRYAARRIFRQTDRQKKWQIEVGASIFFLDKL